MILYLEAVKYKVVTALDALEGQHPSNKSNALSQHIETTRDEKGYQMSILKVCIFNKFNILEIFSKNIF